MADKDGMMIDRIVSALEGEFAGEQPKIAAQRFKISQACLEDIAAGLSNRIRAVAEPCMTMLFLTELNEKDLFDRYAEDSQAEELDGCRDDFVRRITAFGCREIRAEYPALIRQIRGTAERYHRFIREIPERLDRDYGRICAELLGGQAFSLLAGAETDRGDLHQEGRATAVLTTDKGKIVYKPHDVRIDLKTRELTERFFSDVTRSPRVCAGDGYGFTEFIRNDPADTEEKAELYFEHLGGLAAVIRMLGSGDLHHTNLLAEGDRPVVIDHEMMITPGVRKPDRSLAYAFRHSLYYSSLMPLRHGNTEMSILFARDEGNLSAPVVNGRRENIQDHPEAFFRGFRKIYERCAAERDALNSFADSLKGIHVRYIVRGTDTYAEALERMREPAWLRDVQLRDALREQFSIAMRRSGITDADGITEAETEAILRGDIPYFSVRTDSRDLYADGRIVYRDFFPVSCIDQLRARIESLNGEDRRFEEALLRKAMTRVMNYRDDDAGDTQIIAGEKEISDEKLLFRAEDIFRRIADDAVYPPGGGVCWFGPDYFMQTGMRALDSGLVSGIAGLQVFFAAIRKISRDGDVRERADRLLNLIADGMERSLDRMAGLETIPANQENTSLSTGVAGKLLSCYWTGRYLEDGRYRRILRKMLSAAQKIDLRYENTDVLSGMAGLLKVLCRYDDLFSEDGVPELCGCLAYRILACANIPYRRKKLWKTLAEWPVSGAGHGQSGIASALYLAGKRLERSDLTGAAVTGFDFEKNIYSARIHAWPDLRNQIRTDDHLAGYCSGAPGIGLNALLSEYEDAGGTVDRAIESCLKEPLQHKDFLCCGNSAIIEFLLEAGIRTERPELAGEARTRMALVIERAEREGHYHCAPPGVEEVFSPGLFYGAAGIGYEMLRLRDPGIIGSILP